MKNLSASTQRGQFMSLVCLSEEGGGGGETREEMMGEKMAHKLFTMIYTAVHLQPILFFFPSLFWSLSLTHTHTHRSFSCSPSRWGPELAQLEEGSEQSSVGADRAKVNRRGHSAGS